VNGLESLRDTRLVLYDLQRAQRCYSTEEGALGRAISLVEIVDSVFYDMDLAESGHALTELAGFETEFEDATIAELKDDYEAVQKFRDEFNKHVDRLRSIFEVAGLEVW